RVDMFDVEIESLRWFSTFTQRSLAEAQEVQIAPAAELAEEHRLAASAELGRADAGTASAAGSVTEREGRPDVAELLPVERFGALLELVGEGAELLVAAEEELGPALRDHWSDVCGAVAGEDADPVYVRPG